MTEAIRRLRGYMQEAGWDAILLKTRGNFAWLTGGRDNHIVTTSEVGVADLVVLRDRIVCLTNSIEERRILEEELYDFPCDVVSANWTAGTGRELAELLKGKRVGVDTDDPIGTNVSTDLSYLRRTLTLQQQAQYREVAQIAARAVENVAQTTKVGQTEHEIAAALAFEVMRQGCSPTVTLVSSDHRVVHYRHPIPTSKRVERYAMLVVCAEKYGLAANATRFVHFGPLPADLAENRTKCSYIDVQMNAATRPGRSVADVFRIGIEAYREVGYPDDWKLLHQGGPTGYASREYLATLDAPITDIVQVGQAYAWNPAIHGIKSEDTILVGERENEFLTHTGNWPDLEVSHAGKVYHRPDILIRTLI